MELWSIKNVENEYYIWGLNNGFDIRPLNIITLWCNDIKWSETYSYEDEEGKCMQIIKNYFFDKGSIIIPVEPQTEITLFKSGGHRFSMYDLNGRYAFLGGHVNYIPDQEFLIAHYGNDIFEELENIGTDSSVVLLSGTIIIE